MPKLPPPTGTLTALNDAVDSVRAVNLDDLVLVADDDHIRRRATLAAIDAAAGMAAAEWGVYAGKVYALAPHAGGLAAERAAQAARDAFAALADAAVDCYGERVKVTGVRFAWASALSAHSAASAAVRAMPDRSSNADAWAGVARVAADNAASVRPV